MPLYHDKWRTFLNEGTKPQLTEEEMLLAEGRLDDVKKKFPELDKRGIVDDLSAKDPSGNNAYLRWMATQLNNFYEKEEGYAQRQEYQYRIQNVAQSFHKNKQRLKKKDIYQYKTVEELLDAVEKLGASAAAKRKKEKETAMEGSEIVYENDDFFAVRPYTSDASCFYGRATRWCISATKTQNYFDQYSADGKGFVMVRMEHLADDNNEKKIALVYDRDGQLEEIFNAPDDSIDEDIWENAVAVNIIEGIFEGSKYAGKGQMIYNEIWETHTRSGWDEEKKVPGIWKAIAKGIIDKYSDGDLSEPDFDDGDELAEFIHDRLQGIGKEIEYQGQNNIEENPPGPDPAAFQNILDEFEQNSKHIYINLEDYDESVYFSGGLTFEFDEIDEMDWVGDPDFGWNGDEAEKVTDIAREVMDDNYIYPDEIEVDWSEGYRRNPDTGAYERTGDHHLSIRVSLHPDYNEPQTPDGFKEFADRLLGYDENYEAAKDAILEEFYKKGLLKSEALANAQQIQVELENDLKHFDEIKIGDGEITAYGDLHVQLPRIPADFFELSRKMGTGENPGEWYDRKDGLTGMARGMKESYIDFLKNKLLRLMDDAVTRQRFKSSIGKIFKKAEEDADKQLELPLQEADNPYELGNFTYSTVPSQRVYHPESGKFTVPFYVEIPLRDDSLKWNMQFLRDVDRFWSLIEDAYEAAWTGMIEDFVAHNTTYVKRYLSMWDEKEAEEKQQAAIDAERKSWDDAMNEHFQGWRNFLK